MFGGMMRYGLLVAYGVNEKGYREPLDLWVADSESESSWETLFKALKARGLKGIDLVVSDQHSGLVKALKKQFQGAVWQRCQTHFMRNILGHAPRHLRKEIASELKLIFQAENIDTARKLAKDLIEQYSDKAHKAMDCLELGLEHALSILRFPKRYRKRLRTSNLAEGVNEEIRRRQRVIRIFPNEDSATRLIGSLLAELCDEWLSKLRYLDMEGYWDWKQECANRDTPNDKVIALTQQ